MKGEEKKTDLCYVERTSRVECVSVCVPVHVVCEPELAVSLLLSGSAGRPRRLEQEVTCGRTYRGR